MTPGEREVMRRAALWLLGILAAFLTIYLLVFGGFALNALLKALGWVA